MARVYIDAAAVRELMADPGGEVALMLEDLASKAAGVARSTVHVRTGETLSSIQTQMHHDGTRPWSAVSASYAVFFLEKGTKPHIIQAHGDYSMDRDRIDYFGRTVLHPGSRPHPFLTTGLWSLQHNV